MTNDSASRLPETPFGVRLKAARKMAGMSMEDLAKRMGGIVTKQAIGKYEKGKMLPTPDVLARLVEVLQAATRGASPLKLGEAAERQLRSHENISQMQTGHPAPMLFRRQGLFKRLRRPETEETFVRCMLTERESPNAPDADNAVRMKCETLSASLEMRANFSSLADRRARYVNAWASDDALNRILFREGEKLPAKTESALKYRIADHLRRYLELESVLGSVAIFENPLAGRAVRTEEEVEKAAADVRGRWELGSGPIVNLLSLLEDNGIKVYEARGIADFDGLSGQFVDVPFVAVNAEQPADRIRFTAAHELGHIICAFPGNESPESMCHTFGAAFLLPRAALEKAFRPSRRKVTLGDLGELKETYGVSLQAIMCRAHALGLVGDRQLRAFRETIKAKGWVVEEPVAYTGKERASRFRRLLHYAVAAEIMDVDRAAEMAGVPADELKKEIGDIF